MMTLNNIEKNQKNLPKEQVNIFIYIDMEQVVKELKQNFVKKDT